MSSALQVAAALPRARLGRVGHRAVLAVASLGAFLAFLDATIVNVAFPDIAASFRGTSIGALSWILNAYNIVFAALLIGAGRIADLLGRRRAFRVGVAVFTLASLGCATAGSVGGLVALRAVQAVGAALLVPASLALVVEAFPGDRRGHAVGLWGSAAALAAGLGPPIGGALVDAAGWRLAFLVNLPLGLVAWLVGGRLLVESRAPGRRTMPDLAGAAAVAVGLGLLTLALVQGNDWGWASLPVLLAGAGAVAAAAAFVASSRRHPSPVLDPLLIRIPAFAVANVLTVVAGAGFYAYLLTHILWLTFVWHWSVLTAGMALAPGAVVTAAVAGLAGRVADRHGPRRVLVPGAAIWCLAYLWYAHEVGTTPHFLTEWLPGQVLSGIGVGCTLPILATAALASVPGARYATASAVVSSARQLGGVLGVSVLVIIIGAPAGGPGPTVLRQGWLLSAACFAAVAAVAAGARWLRPSLPVAERADDDAGAVYPVETTPVQVVPQRVAGDDGPVAAPPATVAELLRPLPLTAGMSPATFAAFVRAARTLAVQAGDWLFQQGAPADALYVVRSGCLEVVRDGVVVSTVARGDVLGELGVLTRAPRAAGVRARRDSEVVRISRRRFDETVGQDPRALRHLAVGLAGQVQRSRSPGQSAQTRTVAVVATDGLVPIGFVAEMLHRSLSRLARCTLLSTGDAASLETAERGHDIVVLSVGTEPGPWRDFALRQADRVLYVGSGGHDPAIATVGPAVVDVWLLGEPPSRATVDRWHDLGVRTCTALPLSLDAIAAAADRFAARLTRCSVGLVLSGGGARAVAHLGVIDELLAAGIRIDRIAGCSMGAFIAALFACGLTVDEVEDRIYAEFVRANPVGDYTLPRVALTRGKRGRAMLDRVFGDRLIEETSLDFYAVATDLLRHELVVFRRGPLVQAVGASMALPGISPPPVIDGRVCVDGGVLDNMPVGPMAARDEGPIIGVNVVSGLGRDPARAPRVPGLQEIVMRAMTISSATAAGRARDQVRLMVTPQYGGVGLLEFHQYARMREAGRVAARAALAAIGGPAGLMAATPVSGTVAESV